MSNSLKSALKNLIADAQTGEVLQRLLSIYQNNTDAYDRVIKLASRYKRLRSDADSGILAQPDILQEQNRITEALMALINEITDEEADAYEMSQAIFRRILVLCKSLEREAYMRRLLPEHTYKGVTYDLSGQPLPLEQINQFDLVIYDNESYEGEEAPHELLKHYITATKPYLLYFGKPLRWLNDHQEKVYFANSKFSIHARMDEMIRFLRYTG